MEVWPDHKILFHVVNEVINLRNRFYVPKGSKRLFINDGEFLKCRLQRILLAEGFVICPICDLHTNTLVSYDAMPSK